MAKIYREKIAKEELASARIPVNHVLVRMTHTAEGIKSKGGIIVGFRTDETFEGDDSHTADLAEVYGQVYKVPERLFFDPEDEQGMPWECDMELQVGDTVWFSALESKNSVEIECEGQVFKSIPYQDCFVAKRFIASAYSEVLNSRQTLWTNDRYWEVVCLNGYLLCSPVCNKNVSYLDVTSTDTIDKTQAKVVFMGNQVKRYMRDAYNDIPDIRVGDLVQLEPKTPLVWLERKAMIATFDGNNLYYVIQRRRVSLILERNDSKKD
jgi:hypothetical protein